jgi:hypothetical protein
MMAKAQSGIQSHLLLCDSCCDHSGTAKEMIKSGGCTCDICGFSCLCVGDECRQFANRIPVRLIPDEGWEYLQAKNEKSNIPLDWERLFSER